MAYATSWSWWRQWSWLVVVQGVLFFWLISSLLTCCAYSGDYGAIFAPILACSPAMILSLLAWFKSNINDIALLFRLQASGTNIVLWCGGAECLKKWRKDNVVLYAAYLYWDWMKIIKECISALFTLFVVSSPINPMSSYLFIKNYKWGSLESFKYCWIYFKIIIKIPPKHQKIQRFP